MSDTYHSRVYTDRPPYADFDAPAKFQAIMGIIATRLRQHPKAICSYSGGSDSDIMIDLVERTRAMFDGQLPPVKYVFFNTGLEMKAIKDHVKETAAKYCTTKDYEDNIYHGNNGDILAEANGAWQAIDVWNRRANSNG